MSIPTPEPISTLVDLCTELSKADKYLEKIQPCFGSNYSIKNLRKSKYHLKNSLFVLQHLYIVQTITHNQYIQSKDNIKYAINMIKELICEFSNKDVKDHVYSDVTYVVNLINKTKKDLNCKCYWF